DGALAGARHADEDEVGFGGHELLPLIGTRAILSRLAPGRSCAGEALEKSRPCNKSGPRCQRTRRSSVMQPVAIRNCCMPRLHVVGCPRSGTTLLMELLATCFHCQRQNGHELSIFASTGRSE